MNLTLLDVDTEQIRNISMNKGMKSAVSYTGNISTERRAVFE